MTDQTILDRRHAAMQASPEDDAARLAFYGALADAELFLLLEHEPEGRRALSPEILDLEGTRFVLAFDREERLTDFSSPPGETATPAPYAALPGRVIAGMLAGQGIGMGLNLGVAPSSILIPAEAMDWLQATLSQPPQTAQAAIEAFAPPGDAAGAGLIAALTGKLATAGAMPGAQAWLARARFAAPEAEATTGLVLALIGIPGAAHDKLARAAQEALVFSGQEVGGFDTLFLEADSPAARQIAATGLAIPLPRPSPGSTSRPAPGSDPNKPPNLR